MNTHSHNKQTNKKCDQRFDSNLSPPNVKWMYKWQLYMWSQLWCEQYEFNWTNDEADGQGSCFWKDFVCHCALCLCSISYCHNCCCCCCCCICACVYKFKRHKQITIHRTSYLNVFVCYAFVVSSSSNCAVHTLLYVIYITQLFLWPN